MPVVQTERGDLWFADHRHDRSALATLLIHGIGSHQDWAIQIRRLQALNAIAIDLSGHGRSPGAGRDSVAAYAEAVAALLDTLGLPRVRLAGHSMGGAIALTLALSQPKRVASLILIATGARLPVNADLLAAAQSDVEGAVDRIVEWSWAAADPALKAAGKARLMQLAATTLAGDLAACDAFDVRDLLHELHQPCLIIGGKKDRMTPFAYSETLHAGITGSTLVGIENGGHMLMLEGPEGISEVIRIWLVQNSDN
ncbi:MAG: alpha/beta fold hydrolase [Anaerolineae bacterium]|nr:alpha/beta fold hydrolase [Anaerolineae bacterium]